MKTAESTDGSASAGSRWLKPALVVVAVVVIVLIGRQLGDQLPRVVAWVDELGFWAPVIFVLVYVAATVLFVPGSVLTLAGGALFGPAEGTAIVWVAATLGSIAAFLVARYLARSWVADQVAKRPRFAAIDRAVADDGLKITFLLRLSPVFPFSLMNYALGLTRVRLRDYAIASLGMLPGTFLYVYSGYVIAKTAEISAEPEELDVGRYVLIGVGLIATIAVTAIVTRIARRALDDATDV